jgi:hypothetical protein
VTMTMLTQVADHVTVRTALGESEFSNVTVLVIDDVLTVNRLGRTLAWFASGSWQVSFL